MANKSKTYLLPYMAEYIEVKFLTRLVNTYAFMNGEYKFCLLYDFSAKKVFMDYEESLTKNPYYVDSVDVSKEQVVYIFDYPEAMIPIVNQFMDGKYSYLPDKDTVKRYLMTNFGITTSHRIFHILDRTEYLRSKIEESLGLDPIPEHLDLEDPPDKDSEEIII
jgi:hypothetical protein